MSHSVGNWQGQQQFLAKAGMVAAFLAGGQRCLDPLGKQEGH
jgi:hypothetical protein